MTTNSARVAHRGPRGASAARAGVACQGLPAGIVSRSLAAVIDAAVVLVGVLGVWAGSALARFILHPARFSFPSPSVLLSTTAYLGAAFLYLTAVWALTGRSCGAEVMGLRVQMGDGRRPGWLVSAARAALYIAFPVGLVWTAVSRRARSVQDLVVGTAVVYDWGRVGSRPAGAA